MHPLATRIAPSKGWISLRLQSVWDFRELLYFLTWRDIKVRYKQTALGAAWAVLQPLLTMVVFSVFFGRLAGMPSDGVPYPIFSFTALVPWSFFVNGLTQSSNSLVGNSNLIKKVYFPRLVIPLSSVLSGGIDFLIAFALLIVMMALYGVAPSWRLIELPFYVLLVTVTALGAGLWLSALNVEYRDVKYVVPFLSQFWLFATPIAYPSSLLHDPWRTLYAANPMVGVVEGFRSSLLGLPALPWSSVLMSTSTALVLLITGLFYFRRMERTFADIL